MMRESTVKATMGIAVMGINDQYEDLLGLLPYSLSESAILGKIIDKRKIALPTKASPMKPRLLERKSAKLLYERYVMYWCSH